MHLWPTIVDLASKLQAVTAGRHLYVGEEQSDVFPVFHHFYCFFRVVRFNDCVTVLLKKIGCKEPLKLMAGRFACPVAFLLFWKPICPAPSPPGHGGTRAWLAIHQWERGPVWFRCASTIDRKSPCTGSYSRFRLIPDPADSFLHHRTKLLVDGRVPR